MQDYVEILVTVYSNDKIDNDTAEDILDEMTETLRGNGVTATLEIKTINSEQQG